MIKKWKPKFFKVQPQFKYLKFCKWFFSFIYFFVLIFIKFNLVLGNLKLHYIAKLSKTKICFTTFDGLS